MPWKKVIWWVILLVSGLMAYVAYVTYLQLAPMPMLLPTAACTAAALIKAGGKSARVKATPHLPPQHKEARLWQSLLFAPCAE
jgi:hypothetical protein